MARKPDPPPDYRTLCAAYRACFGGPNGTVVMAHLLQMFGSRRSHVRGDPYETAFREGQRDVVRHCQFLADPAREGEALPAQVEYAMAEE